MKNRVFWNADGEMMLVPQQGRLSIFTELGQLEVSPGEICVLPRGMRFKVELPDGAARGYACENYGAAFRLPELGPIGAQGLAQTRDFLAPVAAFEDAGGKHQVVSKYLGKPVRDGACPLAARRGGLARRLRALQVRPGALHGDQHA